MPPLSRSPSTPSSEESPPTDGDETGVEPQGLTCFPSFSNFHPDPLSDQEFKAPTISNYYDRFRNLPDIVPKGRQREGTAQDSNDSMREYPSKDKVRTGIVKVGAMRRKRLKVACDPVSPSSSTHSNV
ncbi:hypothetical protein P7C70_g2334, partial [Phenoliferia sp. Uapishka_3]